MHKIIINTIKGNRLLRSQAASCPSTWSEVTPEQALKILPIVLSEPRSDSVMLRVLSLLIKGVPPSILFSIDPDRVAQMLDCVAFMYEEPMSYPVIPQITISNLFFKKEYLLPAEKLENITCFEWWVADEYFVQFREENDAKCIDLLVATIARERGKNSKEVLRISDDRCPLLNRSEVERRAVDQRKIPAEMKVYVLHFFSCCKTWIHEQFGAYIFEDEEDGDGEGEGNPLGWYGMFQKVAETGVFGTLDTILYHVKFLDFCTYMVGKRLEYDRMEREQEKLRSRYSQNDY